MGVTYKRVVKVKMEDSTLGTFVIHIHPNVDVKKGAGLHGSAWHIKPTDQPGEARIRWLEVHEDLKPHLADSRVQDKMDFKIEVSE